MSQPTQELKWNQRTDKAAKEAADSTISYHNTDLPLDFLLADQAKNQTALEQRVENLSKATTAINKESLIQEYNTTHSKNT